MPVVATHLVTSRTNAAQLSYNTASVTIPAGYLALIAVNSDDGAVAPTVTSASATWTQVANATSGSTAMRCVVFRSLALSDRSEIITINYSSTTNLSSAGWSVNHFQNVDQSGVNGANAIVQAVTQTNGGVNSQTVTLAAFSSSNNATYGAVSINGGGAITQGSGFTELGESNTVRSIQTEFKNTNDTTVEWTFAAGPYDARSVGIELKYSDVDLTKIGGSPLFFSGGVTIG